MDVKAVPGLVIDGFWHKTGHKTVSCRNRPNLALHSNDLVGKEHRVVAVRHVDFELAWRRLFNDSLVGQVLSFKGLSEGYK